MVLLLMSVVLVPLLGKFYCEFALPLMSVDLVPRVGGVGHQIVIIIIIFLVFSKYFQTGKETTTTKKNIQDHMEDIRGCPFGPAMLKRDRHLFEIPGMCAQAHCLQWVQIRDGDVTPFYMTFGLLPF